jgi:hypothetical protein
MKRLLPLPLLLLPLACAEPPGPPPDGAAEFVGAHQQTLRFGADDNSEVIKLLPTGDRAVLVASKSRKVTLLEVTSGGLTELRAVNLFEGDASESELTHIDFDSAGDFAVLTRTKPEVDGEGAVTACGGSLVFIDVSDTDDFGSVLHEVEVGPMPDAVDVSDDDRFVISADEVDFNDGKCPVDEAQARVTVLELTGGDPTTATLRATIDMVHTDTTTGLKREPEQVIVAADNDHVAVTLQDTHELLTFRLSELPAAPAALTSDDLTVSLLENRSGGAEPWPDGVHRFTDKDGVEHFAVAGEFNDTVHLFGLDGTFEAQLELGAADLPGDFPRAEPPAALRPDSVAGFTYDGIAYLALSLKHVGAVGVVRVDDASAPRLVQVVKIGAEDGGADGESLIGTEGISAHDSGVIVTANEDESSASLVSALE